MAKRPREEAVERIRRSIKEYFDGLGKDPAIVVGPSEVSDNIHVMVISDFFKRKEQVDRDSPIYEHMKKNLSREDLGRVSLLLTLTPDEYHRHSEEISDMSASFTAGV